MTKKTHKILDYKLIKVEKLYNRTLPNKLFYNLYLEDFEEPLLIETEKPLTNGILGQKIKYKLNADNEISEFQFL